MSADDIENSDYLGTPVRYFIFTMGTQTWRFIGNSSVPLTIGADTYAVDPVISMGPIQQSFNEAPPTVEIEISSTSQVAQRYLPYMPPEPMRLRVLRTHEESAPGELAVEFIGEIVTSAFDESTGVCTLSAKMVGSALSRRAPWPVYSPTCTFALYGAGCKVDRNAYATGAAAVSAANGSQISADAFAAAGAGNEKQEKWFRNGWVRHVRTGEVRAVADQDGAVLFLQTPLTDFVDGEDVVAYAGCDRTRQVCRQKFNNLPRFMGFPWVPNRNPYTQNIYGTGQKTGSSKSKTNWRKAINPAGWNGSWGLF